jgi:5-(carboxyamino)imidazole ribonucleotide synthase
LPVTFPVGTFPVVGVVGAGQLARMMYQAAIALGVRVHVLAASPEESAAVVAHDVQIGDHRDLDVLRAFAADCTVITFDHEHVPTEHLAALEREGVAVHPKPAALLYAQDKLAMRARLGAAGVPCPPWREVSSADDVEAFAADLPGGWPVVLKAPRGGYDGKGVRVVSDRASAASAIEAFGGGGSVLAEQMVPFVRELAVLVARSPHGQAVAYPCVETVQREGVCREVIAPAPGLSEAAALQAQEVALKVAGELDVTGVLAVEMFELRDADGGTSVVVNELAMRPHNSGHWTIDGAVTSQFEQHLRAVLDLPLGAPGLLAPHAVMANVLGGDVPDMYRAFLHCMAHDPSLRIHMYGKEVKPGRKVGHVTVIGTDLDDLRERADHAAAYLTGDIDE